MKRPRLFSLNFLGYFLAFSLGAVILKVTFDHAAARTYPAAVVLVTVDTLRADAVSFLGAEQQTTPFLDELARKAVVFRNAYAPSSWTAPSMASLFTSLSPESHGVVSGAARMQRHTNRVRGTDLSDPVLPDSLLTLAESFRARGYLTIGVPANRYLAKRLGFGQGFLFYYADADFLTAPDLNRHVGRQIERAFGSNWRQAWKQKKAFLWIHYFDPHIPYEAREPWIGVYAPEFKVNPGAFPAGLHFTRLMMQYGRASDAGAHIKPLYHSEVSYVDDHLRRLNDEIGFDDENVLLILTADHGEELADHGSFGHGPTLYEEVVRVPLLVRWPKRLPPRRVDRPVSLLDLYPTLAQLLGLHAPPNAQGESLGLFDHREDEQSPIFFHTKRRRELEGVRDGNWKLIRETDVRQPAQLFHLGPDPGERLDVAAQNPAIVQRLGALLTERRNSLPAPPQDARDIPIRDEGVKERLRALGYGD